MRRFLTLAFLLFLTVSFGVSISGCSKKEPVVYCNGGDNGPVVGQISKITLSPVVYGISLNQGEIGQVAPPSAADCKGTAQSLSAYTYATFDANGKPDITIADVQPNTGRLCAGTWNRNTGGGIADFTTCNPTGKSGVAYILASGAGTTSNSLPIYVHPIVTGVVLGPLSTDCLHDPATNCSPAAYNTSTTSCTVDPSTGCCTTPVPLPGSATSTSGCVSQTATSQLAARIYKGSDTTNPANNISCLVGHLSYSAQPSGIVTIDQNGIATAQSPGAAIITATISQAGSSAGSFSTCPPTSITLSVPPNSAQSVTVAPNNTQPINATVLDKNGTVLTGVPLTFVSTTPTTIPAANAGAVTPLFPGAASITAICQPPTCNPSPLNQIGLLGNGKAITSNPIQVTAPGRNSTDLYIASTDSLYVTPIDFTTGAIGTPVRLPYQPNSMVISEDGSTVYMGSSFATMTFSTATNSLNSTDVNVIGNVLAVSPDNSTVVITDPGRQLIYLYSGGTIQATYGGVATHAAFTPDSQTVYITMGTVTTPATETTPAVIAPNNKLLVHSAFTGWFLTNSPKASTTPDVTVAVPSVGAFFSGNLTTARGYCPITTTVTGLDGQVSTTNAFYPDAGVSGPTTDRIAATNDGLHVIGATVSTLTDFTIGTPSSIPGNPPVPGVATGACPDAGLTISATPASFPLAGISATAITGVDPTSGGNPATDPIVAFITYTGTGGVLPIYTPPPATVSSSTQTGTLQNIPLATSAFGTPVAPVIGVVSADNQTFYVGTSGDNVVHVLTKGGAAGFQDVTTPIAPKLPDLNGNPVTPNLMVQKPRKATS